VLNELNVTDRSEIRDYPRDAWITTQLKTKMLTDKGVLQINYSVETINGVVYLLGIAQSQDELDRVTNHARNISGVQRVVSYVRLKDDPKRRG
jgi:osmotically-inducible protein OsmY